MSSIGPRSSTPYNGHVSQKIDPLGQRKVFGVNGLAPRDTSGRINNSRLVREQGRIHGYRSRVRVGRGSDKKG